MKVWVVSEGDHEDQIPLFAFTNQSLAEEFDRLAKGTYMSVEELEVLDELPPTRMIWIGIWNQTYEDHQPVFWSKFIHSEKAANFKQKTKIFKHPIYPDFPRTTDFGDWRLWMKARNALQVEDYYFGVHVEAKTEAGARRLMEKAIQECELRKESGEPYEDA